MGRIKRRNFDLNEAVEFLNKLWVENPLLPLVIPVLFAFWAIEKWFFSLSNWVSLALAVWITIQYGSCQRRNLVEDLNKKWMQVTLQTSPVTLLEQCEWLNKLLLEVWPNYISPKLSSRFSSIVERHLKHRKPMLIEKIELQGFSLGSCPPIFGLHGVRWATSGNQRIMHLGFDWDTTEINIMLSAKMSKPFSGTARIVVNSIHVKGDLLLMPILDGKALLYSFVSTPEVRIGVAFGSGGSCSLPATELPGVSSWLVRLATDTLSKRMVEPRRQCLALPVSDLQNKAVGGVLSITVLSARKICSSWKGSPSRRHKCSVIDSNEEDQLENKELQTFVEIELEELTRRTNVRTGSNPKWDSTFNMVLHDNAGILRFHLYECTPGSVKYDYLTGCEIKMRYSPDDSTIFWATGPDSNVIAEHAELCGKEIEMTVPFEGVNLGELAVKLVLKEWQFADGSHNLTSFNLSAQHSLDGASIFLSKTGRKICLTVVEGKDLIVKDKTGKSGPYVKLYYGKASKRTKTVSYTSNPVWNQKFEFDEIGGGEYLKIKCYQEETLGDESIGSARVNLEGLIEGLKRDVNIPLEKVNSGELRLQIEAVRVDKSSHASSGNGWIELVLIEARDLAADLRGTSDPYVRVHYGNLKRSTKIMYKTVNPKWHRTFEFPDDGSPLELHVKDHNALLPTSNIGDCVVEYQMLPPNEMADKWIPLQGVKQGEIHIQIMRKIPELEKKPSSGSELSPAKMHLQISDQMKQMTIKLQSLVDDDDLEGVSKSLSELKSLHKTQEDYMILLETEKALLLNKIKELGQEILNSSPSMSRRVTIP
ncbi:unnamed protein product [Fraxinus pennsylvanica]|uniref:Plant synaptotagmin n=1 Tax=Fraxinus pennsylvanica TaxID=56036 RepID=A0AAD2DI26_9LAMI|nr:unnamed protein product [Fraxinus pennsylvanica]